MLFNGLDVYMYWTWWIERTTFKSNEIIKSQEDYIQKTKTAFKIPTYLLTNLYYKTNENTYICDRLLKYTEWKIRTKARDHENKKEIKKKNRKTTKNYKKTH